MNVTEALHTRISTRAFKPDPLPETLLREILEAARFSPSGGNLQPWRVIALSGAARDAVVDIGKAALASGAKSEDSEYPIYPESVWEPHRSRRFQVGLDMYDIMGIARDDKPARLRQLARNADFFGAPAALFFVTDRRFGHGQWASLGMFMQSIALVAIERGVASCFQEYWAQYRNRLHAHFGLSEQDVVYCGMALGYADDAAPVNKLRSARAEVDEFTTFLK